MTKADYRNMGVLPLIALVIYYPLFYTHYFYTDEITQLWHYRADPNFQMGTEQGRLFSELLYRGMYTSINNIAQITWLRLFSLMGWLCCLPIWYTILARICRAASISALVPFFGVLYLICCPAFMIGVSWAVCMELFIAYTFGLMAGYACYVYLTDAAGAGQGFLRAGTWRLVVALVLGLVSLFTYQNGFGCFLLPFFLVAVSKRRISRTSLNAVGFYLLVYLIYYVLFKWQLHFLNMGASGRSGFATDPVGKIYFMLTQPLANAFHFTWIINERSVVGGIVYLVIFGTCLVGGFLGWEGRGERQGKGSMAGKNWTTGIRYTAGIVVCLFLIYLPSLVVKENYASNRTLLALDLAVFFLVFEAVLPFLKSVQRRLIVLTLIALFFIGSAWYNLRYEFLGPVSIEYKRVRGYIETHYRPGIDTVDFIRPRGDLFHRHYGIASSWDEFGMPSTFANWVPEPFTKQVVYEITGNRAVADHLVIRYWANREEWMRSGNTLVIDVENILQ
jgi:hypothetical protein